MNFVYLSSHCNLVDNKTYLNATIRRTGSHWPRETSSLARGLRRAGEQKMGTCKEGIEFRIRPLQSYQKLDNSLTQCVKLLAHRNWAKRQQT